MTSSAGLLSGQDTFMKHCLVEVLTQQDLALGRKVLQMVVPGRLVFYLVILSGFWPGRLDSPVTGELCIMRYYHGFIPAVVVKDLYFYLN